MSLIQGESLLGTFKEILSNGNELIVNYPWDNAKDNAMWVNDMIPHSAIDGRDMQDKFLNWYNNGHLSASGHCFDIGKTTIVHLLKNEKNKAAFCSASEWTDNASGNGALMRLATIPLYFYGIYLNWKKRFSNIELSELFVEERLLHRVITESGVSSLTTHPSPIAIDTNRYYAALLIGCLQNASKEELLSSTPFVPKGLPSNYWEMYPLRAEVLDVITNFKSKNEDEISNSGYSAKALESALWNFYHTSSFGEGIKKVTRLGDDSDTVAAIAGQLMGCYYGVEGIPHNWIEQLTLKELIIAIGKELLNGPINNQQVSVTYKNVLCLYYNLENSYYDIHRRSNPCPKQFKTMDDFDQAVAQLVENFQQNQVSILNDITEESDRNQVIEISNKILEDFKKRCQDYARPSLKDRLERFSQPSRPAFLLKK
ncbi:predicted protein [Naegleria gruberi]|uniref:Predicted protein n=1 Tax=Naegleria gruberi TaxID=5762 RepID=D2V8P3_NAEGR|nr:uncharacterized protein NAEGRDRAFT_47560 [Naegleria gruberi]EFC46835.1 predicted protein [Naegleria gruberi]|eukprot:XP_002679579.1 predicted protein [Naegleria gruberi strain NEG-M]